MSTTDEELEETLHRYHDAFMASSEDLSLEELEERLHLSLEELAATFGPYDDDDDDDDIEIESDDTSRPLYPDSDPAICIPI